MRHFHSPRQLHLCFSLVFVEIESSGSFNDEVRNVNDPATPLLSQGLLSTCNPFRSRKVVCMEAHFIITNNVALAFPFAWLQGRRFFNHLSFLQYVGERETNVPISQLPKSRCMDGATHGKTSFSRNSMYFFLAATTSSRSCPSTYTPFRTLQTQKPSLHSHRAAVRLQIDPSSPCPGRRYSLTYLRSFEGRICQNSAGFYFLSKHCTRPVSPPFSNGTKPLAHA